ncbi:MAG: hypothetical protein VB029_03370 [Anaerolineaceae bacterium]|jgi:hypothetical protein|nr:hypothetical protein [Anaerolineaceae bacterium]HNX45738.1 hypothetical protein [Anaerolineaceae bacterium]HPT24070.1 hypothetical protein [Anaerolineaceae bacterium]
MEPPSVYLVYVNKKLIPMDRDEHQLAVPPRFLAEARHFLVRQPTPWLPGASITERETGWLTIRCGYVQQTAQEGFSSMPIAPAFTIPGSLPLVDVLLVSVDAN